jgi:hypothetical protein
MPRPGRRSAQHGHQVVTKLAVGQDALELVEGSHDACVSRTLATGQRRLSAPAEDGSRDSASSNTVHDQTSSQS